MHLEAILGDITEQRVDAIVNAANSSLMGGGGVDGAIHRRGGPAIVAACREIRRTTWQHGLPAGQAVATEAGELPARWVIHTVGPVYDGSVERAAILASAFQRSLEVASGLGAESIAFPAISTGVYGWPMDDAARIAVEAVRTSEVEIATVRFVLFDAAARDTFERALAAR